VVTGLILNSEVERLSRSCSCSCSCSRISRYLTVTLIERSSAGRFGPCFDAGSQQIEHEHDDEHECVSLTSESGLIGYDGFGHGLKMRTR
jgi:hypothetical protein